MMQEHRQSSSQHDEAIAPPAVTAAEPAVAQAPGIRTVPPSATAAELTGQAAAPATEPPLANGDALIEQLAHGMVAKDLDARDEQFLHANGYEAMPIMRGAHEFVMRNFVPTQAGKAPVVAFRGTVPSKPQTIIADLDPTGIGMYQFNPNRPMIDAQMAAAVTHGQVISAGHSLGGALAQIAAATFPDRVGSVVTFQAPGVSREMANKLVEYNAAHPDHQIESSHHRVEGDLVPHGGEALTPGVIHNHQMVGGSALSRNPLAKHTSLPLAQEEIAAGHDVPVHGESGSVSAGDVTTEHDNANKSQVVEHIRTGLGRVVYGVGRLGN
jgi:hypothetical protein